VAEVELELDFAVIGVGLEPRCTRRGHGSCRCLAAGARPLEKEIPDPGCSSHSFEEEEEKERQKQSACLVRGEVSTGLLWSGTMVPEDFL
jgi:hypothetical protein